MSVIVSELVGLLEDEKSYGVFISAAEAKHVLGLLRSAQLREGSSWAIRIKYLNQEGRVVFHTYINKEGHLMSSFARVKESLEHLGNTEVSLLGMDVCDESVGQGLRINM